MEKVLVEQEDNILKWFQDKYEINQNDFVKLKHQIKYYIENDSRIHREGLKLTTQKLQERLKKTEDTLR